MQRHLHDNLVHHQLCLGLVLADTLAGDGARVGETGVEDNQPVDALLESLDLDPVVLNDKLAVDQPLSATVGVNIGHLALHRHLLLLCARLVLKRLQELVDRCHPQRHLGLIAVGLALEEAGGLAGNVGDDQAALAAVADLLDFVLPVGVALDDLNLVVEPGDVAVLVVDLAVDGADAVLNLAEALQLAGEVAGSVWRRRRRIRDVNQVTRIQTFYHAIKI